MHIYDAFLTHFDPEHKLDNAILNAALGVAKENENLKEKTEELDERVSELTKKIEIFLNQ